MEESMNAKNFFFRISTKKYLALKLSEFQNQVKIGIFDKKIYPNLKKTGFLEKLFILLGNLNSTFKAINRSLFFNISA